MNPWFLASSQSSPSPYNTGCRICHLQSAFYPARDIAFGPCPSCICAKYGLDGCAKDANSEPAAETFSGAPPLLPEPSTSSYGSSTSSEPQDQILLANQEDADKFASIDQQFAPTSSQPTMSVEAEEKYIQMSADAAAKAEEET